MGDYQSRRWPRGELEHRWLTLTRFTSFKNIQKLCSVVFNWLRSGDLVLRTSVDSWTDQRLRAENGVRRYGSPFEDTSGVFDCVGKVLAQGRGTVTRLLSEGRGIKAGGGISRTEQRQNINGVFAKDLCI